jgi:hypothetical protein
MMQIDDDDDDDDDNNNNNLIDLKVIVFPVKRINKTQQQSPIHDRLYGKNNNASFVYFLCYYYEVFGQMQKNPCTFVNKISVCVNLMVSTKH